MKMHYIKKETVFHHISHTVYRKISTEIFSTDFNVFDIVTHKLLDCNKIVVTLKLLVGQVGVQELRTYFLRRRLISSGNSHFYDGGLVPRKKCVSLKDAHFYGEGAFLRRRRISTEKAVLTEKGAILKTRSILKL